MILYGIPNCDTVKKARDWLSSNGLEYTFHDYKKQGIALATLLDWDAQVGWETLLNRKGTTWRKLDPALQASVVDAQTACALMQLHPSMIKRPVLARAGSILVGFKTELYLAFCK